MVVRRKHPRGGHGFHTGLWSGDAFQYGAVKNNAAFEVLELCLDTALAIGAVSTLEVGKDESANMMMSILKMDG